MEQLNRIELKGRVGQVRTIDTKNNTKVVCFTVCVTNAGGEPGHMDTTWHNCVLFTSGTEAPALKVGHAVHLLGRLRMATFTSGGVTRAFPEIVVNAVEILNE